MSSLETATLEDVWKDIEAKLSDKKEPYAGTTATYEIQITDEDASYVLRFDNGNLSIHAGAAENADCTLKMKDAIFRKFLAGNLNSMTAFMTGKLKVDGNIGLALKLESMLKEYQF
ncbi:SCP2 sterol-binding domain-containing protein [Ornithinibacillus sp. 179-J 7C1 HS]|uniref:SCP2 sterol-binding domain-containing protein n=1 Tax=Ornithinibacillus sp. 179-J 7C1 HS TaxID=3142384 RepID=UPI00399F50E3